MNEKVNKAFEDAIVNALAKSWVKDVSDLTEAYHKYSLSVYLLNCKPKGELK